MELTELHLGIEGLQFVKLQLQAGGTFSQCLFERVDLDSGEVVTHLPRETSLEVAKKFEQGGKLPTPPISSWRRTTGATLIPIPSLRDHLIAVIKRHLSTSASVCIMENPNASRTDPWLKKSAVNTIFFRDEVYHVLLGPTAAPAIDVAVRTAQSNLTFVGAMTSLLETELPSDRGEFNLETLECLAARTDQIFIGAYDGEGYVLWHRRSSASQE